MSLFSIFANVETDSVHTEDNGHMHFANMSRYGREAPDVESAPEVRHLAPAVLESRATHRTSGPREGPKVQRPPTGLSDKMFGVSTNTKEWLPYLRTVGMYQGWRHPLIVLWTPY